METVVSQSEPSGSAPRMGLSCHADSSCRASGHTHISPQFHRSPFTSHKTTSLLYCPKWLFPPKVRRERNERWREGGGEDPFHRLNIKKKSSFYLRMKRKQMIDGGASLEVLNHFHKAIPANSPSVKNLAMFTGGQLQMCPPSPGKEKASASSSSTTVSGKQWCPSVPLVLFWAKRWRHWGIWFSPYIKED